MVARKVSQTIARHRENPEQHLQSAVDAEDAESENAQSSSPTGEESDTSYLSGMSSSLSAVRGSELGAEEESCAASPLKIALLFALLMVATQVPLPGSHAVFDLFLSVLIAIPVTIIII